MREYYKSVPCYSIDKLMSGSSLEGKAFLRNHAQNSELKGFLLQILISKTFYFRSCS